MTAGRNQACSCIVLSQCKKCWRADAGLLPTKLAQRPTHAAKSNPACSGLAESIMPFPFTTSVVVVIIIKCNKL